MANEQNLIPFTSEQSREQAKINGHKGGIASGIARRARRDFRESMLAALGEIVERKDDNGNVMSKISAQDAICIKQIAKALKGDTAAAKFCVEVAQEKQKQFLGGFQFVVEPGDEAL